MKGIIILLLVGGASYLAYDYFKPVDLATEFKKDPQAALLKVVEQANLERGRTIGEGRGEVMIEEAQAEGANTLTLNYRLSRVSSNDLSTLRIAEAQPLFLHMVCSMKDTNLLLQNQVMIKTRVRANDGAVLFVQRVTRDKCSRMWAEEAGTPAAPIPSDRARMKCRNLENDPEAMEACIKAHS